MTKPITKVPALAPDLLAGWGAALTDVGAIREYNEDVVLCNNETGVWAVADGMGGHADGRGAATKLIAALDRHGDDGVPPLLALRQCLQAANSEIFGTYRGTDQSSGATTVALLLRAATAHIAWVGDCRAYLIRDGRLRRLTRDHSLVEELVAAGKISAVEAVTHREAHVVTRAIGPQAEVEVDTLALPATLGDRFILCSDGLWGTLGDDAIACTVAEAGTPEVAAAGLIAAALEAKANDNVSAVVIEVDLGVEP